MRFSKAEIKHIKWRLINQEGLSPDVADKRIKKLIAYDTVHNKKLVKPGIKRKKPTKSIRKEE